MGDDKIYELISRIYMELAAFRKEAKDMRDMTDSRFDRVEARLGRVEGHIFRLEKKRDNDTKSIMIDYRQIYEMLGALEDNYKDLVAKAVACDMKDWISEIEENPVL